MAVNFISFSLLFFCTTILIANNEALPINLLKNSNIAGTNGYLGIQHHQYEKRLSHSQDGSGSIKLVGHWYTKQFRTPYFKLEKNKHYTIGTYMKAIGSKFGQNIMFKIGGVNEMSEMNWNISTEGEWEEIAIPYRAKKTGLYYISIFTHRYALSTNNKYVNKKGDNLNRNATIYFDDFFVYKSKALLTHEKKSLKKKFNSNFIQIDSLGNWSVKEKGKWKNIFPKFTYQDWEKDRLKKYKEYGFTGIINIDSTKTLHDAIDNGLMYNGIQINHLKEKTKTLIKNITTEIIEKKILPTSLLLYNFDNEAIHLSNHKQTIKKLIWVKKYDQEHPIYMLNGVAEGLTRQYNNIIDVTGTYITATGNEVEKYENPINSFSILEKSHNQKVPISMMQLQCYYHKLFIPSIFKGLGEGAKALTFWRGGKHLEQYNCPNDFTENVWAKSIKGQDGIFKKIDTLLPILREPLKTDWNASVNIPSLISISPRDYNSKHYLFLANFSKKEHNITIKLKGLKISNVKNIFSKKNLIFNKKRSEFSIYINKYNKGYLVLELN